MDNSRDSRGFDTYLMAQNCDEIKEFLEDELEMKKFGFFYELMIMLIKEKVEKNQDPSCKKLMEMYPELFV
jgi:hypothetical protein